MAGLPFPDASMWWVLPTSILIFFLGCLLIEALGRRKDDPAVMTRYLPMVGAAVFLSAFFALVGTHGLHVSFGIVWLVTLMAQVKRYGLIAANRRRLMCLSMFWHFLDVIWIGVFTFVYLMGVLP